MEYKQDTFYDEWAAFIRGLGYHLVDASHSFVKDVHRVSLIIHSQDGVGTEACAEVHRTVRPRMEVVFDSREVQLEVSSPGLERKFAHPREFAIFQGRKVKILLKETQSWIKGTIVNGGTEAVEILTADGPQTLAYSQIGKAQLEFEWEVN